MDEMRERVRETADEVAYWATAGFGIGLGLIALLTLARAVDWLAGLVGL